MNKEEEEEEEEMNKDTLKEEIIELFGVMGAAGGFCLGILCLAKAIEIVAEAL